MTVRVRSWIAPFLARPLWQKRLAFALIGAVGGFAYYYYIGCASGTCPISSNPYISTAYGALMGILIPTSKKTKPSENPTV